MARIDLVRLKKEDAPEIQDLFERCYPARENITELYWEWLFEVPEPYKYISIGLRQNGLLVGYYAAMKYDWSAMCMNAMIDPDMRGLKFYNLLAQYLYWECKDKYKLDYIDLFDNENIHKIHLKHGLKPVFQMKEYRIPVKDIDHIIGMGFYPKKYKSGTYDEWRYKKHPYNTYIDYERSVKTPDGYIRQERVIYSTYEDRIQIIFATHMEHAIRLASHIAKLIHKPKKTISFWSEEKLKYPYIKLPTYYMFKNFHWRKDKHLKQYLKTQPLYMGVSDVF